MKICDQETTLGFMIADLSRLLNKVFNQKIKDQPVSSAQWFVLKRLLQDDGMTQSELADRVEIEQSSLVRHLDNLEAQGLIERRPDKNDRRSNRIYLTEACKPIFESVTPILTALRAEMIQDLEPGEFDRLMSSLKKVKERALLISEQGESV